MKFAFLKPQFLFFAFLLHFCLKFINKIVESVFFDGFFVVLFVNMLKKVMITSR